MPTTELRVALLMEVTIATEERRTRIDVSEHACIGITFYERVHLRPSNQGRDHNDLQTCDISLIDTVRKDLISRINNNYKTCHNGMSKHLANDFVPRYVCHDDPGEL